MPPERRPVGDRIEEALEHRADVEGEIARGEVSQPTRRRVVRTAFWLAICGASLYLVAPAVLETLASWDDVKELAPAWIPVMVALQAASVGCLWWLQRIALKG